MGKMNLTLQINALEAKQGLEPRIQLSKYIKPVDADLEVLRREKVKQHLFHLQKVLNRVFKKAKTFTVQRVVKKLKKVREEGNKGEEVIKGLEGELVLVKAYKMEEKVVFGAFMRKCSDYCREKCAFLTEHANINSNVDLQAESSDLKIGEKIMLNNTFGTELAKLATDFELFLKKLYHEGEEEFPEHKKQQLKRQAQNKNSSPPVKKREYFVETLDERLQKRSKNRPGQAARRKLAEEKYGERAKHLTAGKAKVTKSKRYHQDREESDGVKRNAAAQGELHPSWQARREVKEKLSKVKFQGQRITFDD